MASGQLSSASQSPVPAAAASKPSFGLSFSRLSSVSSMPNDNSDVVLSETPPLPSRSASDAPKLTARETTSFSFPDTHENDSYTLQSFSAGDAASAPPQVPKQAALSEVAGDIDPSIIFRFPPEVAPPPTEVSDFCMPVGAKLFRINPREEETTTLKILYSHEGSRSSRCFIFMLEDRTVDVEDGDDELGDDTGRLYGICVLHHRLLLSSPAANGAPIFEFITPVCYCFITRFPLFDFFFQVIWSMVSGERLQRMEGMQNTNDDAYDRRQYKYIPEDILRSVLQPLSRTRPPRFGERLIFTVPSSSTTVETIRLTPPGDVTEHHANAATWAVPVLLDWLSARLLTWAIGLLMCEAKLIVVGNEPGLVSCAVMGLMGLLKPLTWVAPLIPILPLKHIDFIEAPVPIVAGVVLHGEAFSMLRVHSPSRGLSDITKEAIAQAAESSAGSEKEPNAEFILNRCKDDETVTAVLDLSVPEIYVSSKHMRKMKELLLPGAIKLVESFHRTKSINRTLSTSAETVVSAPQYSVTPLMREDARTFQELLRPFLGDLVSSAEKKYEAQSAARDAVVDEHVKKRSVRSPESPEKEEVDAISSQTPFQSKMLQSSLSFASEISDEQPEVGFDDPFLNSALGDDNEVAARLKAAVSDALKCDDKDLPPVIETEENQDDDFVSAIVGLSTLSLGDEDEDAFFQRFFDTQVIYLCNNFNISLMYHCNTRCLVSM
jgi:hypothetical protein